MLDGFFGRKTPHAWRLNPSVPIPTDTMRPGLEGTGPAIDLGHGDGRAQHRRGVVDVGLGRRRRRLQGSALSGVGEPARSARSSVGRQAVRASRRRSRAASRASTRSICRRRSGRRSSTACPGLHLQNRQISLDGEQVPAIIPALVMHAVNNYDTQKKNGSGVYYYVPKIETWQEARLVVEPAEGARGGARACRAAR